MKIGNVREVAIYFEGCSGFGVDGSNRRLERKQRDQAER